MNLFKKNNNAMNTTREKEFILSVLGDLVKLFKKYKAILAGGCITSIFSKSVINDFDIFVDSDEVYKALHKELINLSSSIQSELVFESDNACTFKIPLDEFKLNRVNCSYGIGFTLVINEQEVIIQIINPLLSSTKDLLSKFDFTVCMGMFDFNTQEFTFDERFLIDLARKELHYNPNCSTPFGAMFRMKKYLDKGFTISPAECMKIILSCRNVKINTFKDFVESIFVIPDTRLKAHLEALCSDNDGKLLEEDFSVETALEWIEDYLVRGPYIPDKYKWFLKPSIPGAKIP